VDFRIEKTWRRGVQRTIATLVDESGAIDAIWYGRRFIERRLHVGQQVVASGRVKAQGWTLTLEAPEFSPDEGDAQVGAGRIVPVYRLTTGITAPTLRRAIRALLDTHGATLSDPLPHEIRDAHHLMGLREAIQCLHWPEEFERRDAALRRLAFDELLAVQCALVRRRRRMTRGTSPLLKTSAALRAAIEEGVRAGIGGNVVGATPEWTSDQAAAIEAICAAIAQPKPMMRLLQGDVGTGKTAVAFVAAAVAARAGYQTALLAPTELLARQHAATAARLLTPLGVLSVLRVGSQTTEERRTAQQQIADGSAALVIGTHALFTEATEFSRLGLVVVDEQHRFGVEERSRLLAKGDGEPHLLLMTATPIPRTIAQLLYADMDVSELRSLPAGRKEIRTAIRTSSELDRLWEFVQSEASAGRQTFVVVPRISADPLGEEPSWYESPELDAAAAKGIEEEADRIRLRLPGLRVGVVHGAQPATVRTSTMAEFARGALDLLVGTTVIEVGVDVPQASTMIVLTADRFGLATLHQLRGRVGRGGHEGWCVLVSDSDDEVAQARLRAIAETRDGFVLAERDMELRGEGSVLGTAQSGLPPLRVANLGRADDRVLAVEARRVAEELLSDQGDPLPSATELLSGYAAGWPVGSALAGGASTPAPA
jgi:ATP-dependent DNA helicase RecG